MHELDEKWWCDEIWIFTFKRSHKISFADILLSRYEFLNLQNPSSVFIMNLQEFTIFAEKT